VKIWSKGGLKALCGECGEVFESEKGITEAEKAEIKRRVYEALRAKYG